MEKEQIAAGDMAMMMAEFAKRAAPAEQHKQLSVMEGAWNVQSRIWISAGASPQQTEGKAEKRAILGGRFVEERFHSSFAGAPLEGYSLTGFNNATREYMSVWLDSSGTGMIFSTGGAESAVHGFTTSGPFCDPMSGQTEQGRWVTRFEGRDKHVVEMFRRGPDGNDFKSMEITYTRA